MSFWRSTLSMSRGDANLFFFFRVDDDDDASNPRLLESVDTRENVCMRESMFCDAPEGKNKKERAYQNEYEKVGGTKNTTTTNHFLFSLSRTNRAVASLLRACSDANTNTNRNTNINTVKGMGRRGS